MINKIHTKYKIYAHEAKSSRLTNIPFDCNYCRFSWAGWEDIADCSVRALRVCHHELRPAAAAAHHLAVPEEHIVGEEGGFGSRSEAEHRYVTLPL